MHVGADSTSFSIVVLEQVKELTRLLVEPQHTYKTIANPGGRVIMDEAEVQQAVEHYAQMEAELQALRQRNDELMRAVQEQQDIVEVERKRADRRSRAQTQEFANLTAELIAQKQGTGPAAQFEGMRFNLKVEKPETYDGDKARDLDTWLFQVREHLELSTVPMGGRVMYTASLLRGNAALWWKEASKANR